MSATQLELLAPAVIVPRKFPLEPIARTAEIDPLGYRWTAMRAWGSGPCIIWVLLNPSKADGRIDDPTMLRMIGFSFRWGFGSLKVMNVYPFISPSPAEMRRWRKTWDFRAWEETGMRSWEKDKSTYSAFMHNIHLVTKHMSVEETTYVAAWGNGVDESDLKYFIDHVGFRFEDDEFGMMKMPVTWHCLGKNENGSPVHPLARGRNRIPDDATLKVWRKGPKRRRVDAGDYP
jgi:hypothetical protein